MHFFWEIITEDTKKYIYRTFMPETEAKWCLLPGSNDTMQYNI